MSDAGRAWLPILEDGRGAGEVGALCFVLAAGGACAAAVAALVAFAVDAFALAFGAAFALVAFGSFRAAITPSSIVRARELGPLTLATARPITSASARYSEGEPRWNTWQVWAVCLHQASADD